jgi:hypothetical protein
LLPRDGGRRRNHANFLCMAKNASMIDRSTRERNAAVSDDRLQGSTSRRKKSLFKLKMKR